MQDKYIPPNPPIEGWMSENELQWLYERGKEHAFIAEIGCWFGRSTHALLSGNEKNKNAIDRKVYVIDTFKGSPSEPIAHAAAKTQNVQGEFKHNCGMFGNLVLFPGSSLDYVRAFSDGDLDMVFIDGEHTKEALLADLKAWVPKVRLCGLISGHDRMWPGVKEALVEFFGVMPAKAVDGIWAIQKEAELSIL
jgi:predicted O-methyltransferase YrrM